MRPLTLELSEVYRLSGTEDAPKSFGEKLSQRLYGRPCRHGAEALEDFAVWLAYSWLGYPDLRGGRVCGREAHHPPAPGKEAAEARQEKEKRGRFRR